ncbi:MAG TPA: hypothetical protein VK044_10640 [Virgibacillus sp.]|nr:hypothetical protein [Virgibacillus sp.]
MNGWLIYNKKDALENESYIKWMIDESKKQQLSVTLVLREDISTGIFANQQEIRLHNQPVRLPLFAIVRTIDPLLSHHLENAGVKTFNTAYISKMCNHKSITHYELNHLGIPMVDSLFVKKASLPNRPPFIFPFVVKEATGRSGKQVHLIDSHKEWDHFISLSSMDDLVIQSADVKIGKDVRVFIVGKEIVGAVLRENKNDFRANFKLGGTAQWYDLDDHEWDMIHKIIHHFDFDFVGIDFLISLDGHLLFNEIEDVVGSRILSAVSSINILQKYSTHIRKVLLRSS